MLSESCPGRQAAKLLRKYSPTGVTPDTTTPEQLTEKGHLLIKKPGKMRWEYTSPEQKLFVSDGVKIYSYIPQDKQVVVSSVPTDDTASAPDVFLAGKGNLVRDFTATLTEVPAGMLPGTKALKLVPKKPQPDYDWIVLLVDQTTLGLRGLMSTDAQGGTSTFSFANLKKPANALRVRLG